ARIDSVGVNASEDDVIALATIKIVVGSVPRVDGLYADDHTAGKVNFALVIVGARIDDLRYASVDEGNYRITTHESVKTIIASQVVHTDAANNQVGAG